MRRNAQRVDDAEEPGGEGDTRQETCTHHWLLGQTTSEGNTKGKCKKCGKERLFNPRKTKHGEISLKSGKGGWAKKIPFKTRHR